MEKAICLVVAGYLVGSIPFGYVLVRVARGDDVRRHGSHNVGAINVFRVGGKALGLLTLLLDSGKAFALVLLASVWTAQPAVIAATAFSVVVGHAYSVWFLLREGRFSEGKSVACGLGILVALGALGAIPWLSALTPIGVWVTFLVGPRILTGRWWCISMATMAAVVSVPIAVWSAHPDALYLALSAGMSALIMVRHKNNIRRLLSGTEPRLSEMPKQARHAAYSSP